MKMTELFSFEDYKESLFDGHIRERYFREELPALHPDQLRILNYTEKAAYEGVWNNVTRNCRGLIVDSDNNIIARPFRKFMNYGQAGAAEIALDEPVEVTDKMDGSLGIIFVWEGLAYVATRGSFHSDQAHHATALLRKKYPDFNPAGRSTFLVEIVYPENRIVLDYGDQDDLVLLGAVHKDTGQIFSPELMSTYWTGPITQVFEYATLADALAAPIRKNAEGVVVRSLKTDAMIKIKQEDYIRLHRIVTGLNERTVWEALSTFGEVGLANLVEAVPDEFHGWLDKVSSQLWQDFDDFYNDVYNYYVSVIVRVNLPDDVYSWTTADKKTFALKVQEIVPKDMWSFVFSWQAGRSGGAGPDAAIWKKLRPSGDTKMKEVSEDTA